MGRHTNESKGIIEPYKINEEKEGLKQLYDLKMFKVYIINDKYVYCTGTPHSFMNRLNQIKTVAHGEMRNEIKKSYKLEVIEDFRTKLDAINYAKQHYPELTMIKKLLAEGDDCHYKILLQLHPEDPNNILIVYPNYTKFIKENNLGFHTFGKNVDGTKLMGGYYWLKSESFNYPPTVHTNKYQDILNLNQPLPAKAIANRYKVNKLKQKS